MSKGKELHIIANISESVGSTDNVEIKGYTPGFKKYHLTNVIVLHLEHSELGPIPMKIDTRYMSDERIDELYDWTCGVLNLKK